MQVAVLACAYYYIFLFFRGTRGAQVVVGLVLLLAILIGLTQVFSLDALNWILRRASFFLGAAFLIIFQPEIRRALAELGKQPVLAVTTEKATAVDNIVAAVSTLAEHRVGGLIAVEREIGTRVVQETGVQIDAPIVPELLASIFFPHTPLHDGGVIIKDNRIAAAGCIFPLSQKAELQKQLGTRHRAAVGLCEETDAVAVIVSEETGTISVGYRGRLIRGLDADRLRRFLAAVLVREPRTRGAWQRARRKRDLTPAGNAKSREGTEGEATGG